MTGKTMSAVELGYISKDNIDELRKAGFVAIPSALETETIPSIEKIIMMETENAFRKQSGRILERSLIGPLLPKMKIKYVPPITKRLINEARKPVITQETIDNVNIIDHVYNAYIEDICGKADMDSGTIAYGKADRNTLFIFDSASRYKLLLDLKTGIDMKLSLNGVTDKDTIREIRQERWANRNNWWMYFMTLLRGARGWATTTFMEAPVSDWVLDMAEKGGKEVDPIKRVWIDNITGFNFDMIYQFTEDPLTKNLNVKVDKGRYVYRGEGATKFNDFTLETKGPNAKFSFLWAIEGMVKSFESGKTL